MKTQPTFRRLTAMSLMSMSLLFMGCGSFETVSYYNDGIYGDEAIAVQPTEKANGAYYKKYFDEKAIEANQSSGGVLFTDPNTYTDNSQNVPEATQYQTYGNWGEQTDQINITINGYYPYHYGYTPYYNYYYWDAHYRPWWRHRYRSWYGWSYHYYPSYYYGWYGHYNPYYGYYPYYYPNHNSYYYSYGSGVTYSHTKGRRGGASSTSATGYVVPRSGSGYSVDSSTTTSPTAGRSSYVGRGTYGNVQSTSPTTDTSSSTSNFMNRDYASPRVYQRSDGRKAVSAGSSNNRNSSYQVRSYRANPSNSRASQTTRSSNYSPQRTQSTSSPSYNSSSSRSNSSYSSGRSSSSRSSSSGRSSSGSSRSSSSGRR